MKLLQIILLVCSSMNILRALEKDAALFLETVRLQVSTKNKDLAGRLNAHIRGKFLGSFTTAYFSEVLLSKDSQGRPLPNQEPIAFVDYSYNVNNHLGSIDNIEVVKPYRNLGIATALLTSVKAILTCAGAHKVELEANPIDEPQENKAVCLRWLVRFYESHGFKGKTPLSPDCTEYYMIWDVPQNSYLGDNNAA